METDVGQDKTGTLEFHIFVQDLSENPSKMSRKRANLGPLGPKVLIRHQVNFRESCRIPTKYTENTPNKVISGPSGREKTDTTSGHFQGNRRFPAKRLSNWANFGPEDLMG